MKLGPPVSRRRFPLYCVLAIAGLVGVASCDSPRHPEHSSSATSQGETPTHGPSEQRAQSHSRTHISAINLVDVSDSSQIDFVHFYDGHGAWYIVEAVASGLASFDYDRDGLTDIYFLNGAAVHQDVPSMLPNQLYRNRGNMRFSEVTQSSGVGDTRFSLGVATADYDNDGFADIYVNNFGRNRLYRNNGDGTFTDATAVAGVSCAEELGAGVCFLDADGDGALDLYVGNYVKDPVINNSVRTTDGFRAYPGPLDFEPERDYYFRNRGDGTFADESTESGVATVATTSMGVIAVDVDDDGDMDILVANDVERNLLWLNDGQGNFTEVGIQSGIAFSFEARRNGNMGIDAGDFDQDGHLDIFSTTFHNEFPVLYQNDGFGNFMDVTLATGTGKGLKPHANWGTAFADLENDGDLDLVLANGDTDPNVGRWSFNTAWKLPNTVFENRGDGRFENISENCGSGLLPVESSRGLVAEDFDNDGDIDLIVLNSLAASTVIRNDSTPSGSWLQVELIGVEASRDATGAMVNLLVDGKTLVQQVHSGRGYQSGFGQRLHFGLGSADSVDQLRVRWSTGKQTLLENVTPNQRLQIIQEP